MTSACRVIFALATSACTLPQHQARQPRTVVTTGGAVVAPYDTDFFQLPRVVIPKGFQLATGGSNSTMSKHTYLPVGALPHDWKTRFVVVTETRDAGGDLDRFLDDLQVEMRKACAGEPVVDIPQRFVDDGFPAAIQSVRCGATNDDGEARLVLYKVIVGDHVFTRWNSHGACQRWPTRPAFTCQRRT